MKALFLRISMICLLSSASYFSQATSLPCISNVSGSGTVSEPYTLIDQQAVCHLSLQPNQTIYFAFHNPKPAFSTFHVSYTSTGSYGLIMGQINKAPTKTSFACTGYPPNHHLPNGQPEEKDKYCALTNMAAGDWIFTVTDEGTTPLTNVSVDGAILSGANQNPFSFTR